jgi:hypothetical protein
MRLERYRTKTWKGANPPCREAGVNETQPFEDTSGYETMGQNVR